MRHVWTRRDGVRGLQQAAVTALPSSSCGKLQYGGSGDPEYIIASDLPLQGANRALTTEMSEAVAYILGQQNWKAGKYIDRLPVVRRLDRTGGRLGHGEVHRERERVRADDSAVLGIIGTFNSGCAKIEIPIATVRRRVRSPWSARRTPIPA